MCKGPPASECVVPDKQPDSDEEEVGGALCVAVAVAAVCGAPRQKAAAAAADTRQLRVHAATVGGAIAIHKLQLSE